MTEETSTPSPRVEVFESPDELATSVAGAFLRMMVVRQAADAVVQVGLTGGTIADLIHREIARLAPGSDVDWSRIDFFWGDERFVPAASDDRNSKKAREDFLDAVGVDPARVYEIPSTDDAESVDAAATAYGEIIRAVGQGAFDLLMLGMGPDGHIASLFPGLPQLDADDTIAVPVTGSPKPPPERVSLTFPTLNRSDVVWFVVTGVDKAPAVGRALAEPAPDAHEIPATGVRGRLETIWFLDREAASEVR
ncbi:MAG: 6-phosphogluconolactonase [Nocardioides sp.]|nr:6-phosphogluconolactonase [Nocardioides sp.]